MKRNRSVERFNSGVGKLVGHNVYWFADGVQVFCWSCKSDELQGESPVSRFIGIPSGSRLIGIARWVEDGGMAGRADVNSVLAPPQQIVVTRASDQEDDGGAVRRPDGDVLLD
jgi:hypothetical protein